jgi:hypothetical protein
MAKKNYTVKVEWMDPFPKESEYRTEGSNIVSGTAKGLRQFRKDNKGRKIKNITIKVLQY